MDRMVIEALKHKYEAEKADARETFKTSDIMEDIDDALHKWSVADRKLQDIHLIEWELEDYGEEEEPTLFDSMD
jgi:transcriptional regulator NrdR family protein